MTIKPANLVQW